FGQSALAARLLVTRDLVALLTQQLLGLIDERVGVVANLGLFAATLVVFGVRLGVAHHLIDGVLVKRRLAGDRHRLLLARGAVLGRNVHDAVGVDCERDLDRRTTSGRGRQ